MAHQFNVQRVRVDLAIHRNGLDPQLPRSADDAARNLPPTHPPPQLKRRSYAEHGENGSHLFAMRILSKSGLRPDACNEEKELSAQRCVGSNEDWERRGVVTHLQP